MKTIEILAPAKINLFLKIINKRKDDFHTIETVFEKVSLCDKLLIKECPGKDIVIASNSRYLSSLKKNNLVYRAADCLRRKNKIKHGVFVYLEKNIPIAAGLGGGSSDAASVLQGLNLLWRLGLTQKDLVAFSRHIGSDVALFMFHSGFLVGRGRGDEITPCPALNSLQLWHILIIADVAVSTPRAYVLFDKHFFAKETHSKKPYLAKKMHLTIPDYSATIITHALLKRDVSLLNYYSYNSFKDIIVKQFPQVARLKKKIEAFSKEVVHLSGSGPSLFITFSQRKEALSLAKKLQNSVRGCRFFLVSTHKRDID